MQTIVIPLKVAIRNEHEATYGKPVLLTDCEIAVLLDMMRGSYPITTDGVEALDHLWVKFVALFAEEEISRMP